MGAALCVYMYLHVCIYIVLLTSKHESIGRADAKMGKGRKGSCSVLILHPWNQNLKRSA